MEYQTIQSLMVQSKPGERTIPIGAVVLLNAEQATRLMVAGKVVPIEPEVQALGDFVDLFEITLAELATLDPKGEAVQAIQKDAATWREIQSLEDKINELWIEAESGRIVWPEYCGAVGEWKKLFITAITGG